MADGGPSADTTPWTDAEPPRTDGATESWSCRESFGSTFDHVQDGRAYICGANACAYGSNDQLGLYNVVNRVKLREVSRGFFEFGPCL